MLRPVDPAKDARARWVFGSRTGQRVRSLRHIGCVAHRDEVVPSKATTERHRKRSTRGSPRPRRTIPRRWKRFSRPTATTSSSRASPLEANDINDFDETLPAPWEWDLKRLAASFAIASRNNGLKASECVEAAETAARSYREHMADYARMSVLDVWYDSIGIDRLLELARDAEARKRGRKRLKKEAAKTVAESVYPKLGERTGERHMIKDQPPLIFHLQARPNIVDDKRKKGFLEEYRETLQEDRRVLFDRYELSDMAVKVVGVGSVGTMCAIALFMASDTDSLFLQVKEARTSVLEPYAGKSGYKNHGQRVVVGQRLMQSASDIFLGWLEGRGGRHFYVRQLRDVKLSAMVELFDETTMIDYASACGWALARAHARGGDSAQIAGYMGKSDEFDRAIADFAVAYADQNERDHAALVAAIRSGRLEAEFE